MNKITTTIILCTIAIVATLIYTKRQPSKYELTVGGKTLGEHKAASDKKNEYHAKIFVNQTARIGLIPYKLDVGSYPSTEEGLKALLRAPLGKENKWKGPYMDELSMSSDPWGRPYQYRFPGLHNEKGKEGFDIWSLGIDGRKSEDDIGNWE